MKQRLLYSLIAALLFCNAAHAAPGDTTWVYANNVQLNYYNNFDTSIVFPHNSALTYRKVYMIFTLGKYACPGSPQYCGDWDYTVQTLFMSKHTSDTAELGRFMTPYAHTGFGRFSATWTNRYIFDVTDYYPMLKDTGTVRIHYSGYSGGFTGNVKFAFVEGTPERNVLKVDRLWHGDFDYGHGPVPLNTALSLQSKTAPAGTQSAEMKFNITGHGGDVQACAEFCPNTYTVSLNSNQLVQQNFFRTDCSANELYAQSGTWIYSRANWCPGALVRTFTYKLTNVGSGSAYNLGITFPPYTSTTSSSSPNAASYTIDGGVIYYGAINKATDATLEDIIAPTNAEYHYRENPSSGAPIFTVRNSGAAMITSIKFQYGVTGKSTQTYTWSGSILPLQNMDVVMPVLPDLKLAPGQYGFAAKIIQVNGAVDADTTNNKQVSTFTSAPVWPSQILVYLRSNDENLGSSNICETSWKIEDMAGNLIKKKSDCPLNTTCVDTVNLPFGAAFKLTVMDSSLLGYYNIPSNGNVGVIQGDGLSGYSSTNGYFRVYDIDGNIINITETFNGNFGAGFVKYFYTGWPNAVQNVSYDAAIMKVFPNPARTTISVLVDGLHNATGNITLYDMMGRAVATQAYGHGITAMDVRTLPAGIYQLVYDGAKAAGGKHLSQRIVIKD